MALHFLANVWLPGNRHLVTVVTGGHPGWKGYFDSTAPAFSEPVH